MCLLFLNPGIIKCTLILRQVVTGNIADVLLRCYYCSNNFMNSLLILVMKR